MFRIINVGTSALEYIEKPLVPDDVFAYKIVWNTGEKEGATLKVTAILSDGSVVYDTGSVLSDGTATYILSSNMYSVSGSMELRLSIVSGSSVLTDRILIFTVLEGAGEDKSYAETKYQALDSLLVKTNSVLGGAESHLNNDQNPHKVTKEQIGLSNVDNTSDIDKPVSDATAQELKKFNPVGKVKENSKKTILLPNLKGGVPLKSLFIGQREDKAMSDSYKMNISLESANLIDALNFDKWEQLRLGSGKYNAFFDITDLVRPDENGNYPVLGLSYEVLRDEYLPQYFSICSLKESNGTSNDILSAMTGKSYFVSTVVHLTKAVLDFSLVADVINDTDNRICLSCGTAAFVSSSNAPLFNGWLSRFKYLQLERLNTIEDEISDFYLGTPSMSKSADITLKTKGYGGTFVSANEIKDLYLDNSGTAKLIINTSDTYSAPSDISVEYFEDADLKYKKMEVDLKKLISTNTTAIIANGGSQ